MKIFVIHYKKLIERKEFIINQFKKYNITEYEFIEIDRDELEGYDLSIFENISNPYMAIGLSHIYAYNKIKDNYDEALIFEDDVILCDNFINIFNYYLTQLPKDFDMLFLGSCCNLKIQEHNLIPNKHIYEKSLEPTEWGGLGSTRALYSYLVSKKCAIKICKYIDSIKYKIDLATDQWINIVARDINLKMYWAEPTIAIQGSEIGIFEKSYDMI
jgi:GR25 family glycosyltransferase involved in LPS biosynthesis